ncbi:MAG: phosphoserine phosphatase SerB [Kiloniellales bacterium]
MELVLTLIGSVTASGLPITWVEQAADRLGAGGARVGQPDWLSEDEACDLPFDGIAKDDAAARLNDFQRETPADCFIQATAGRRKALLVADMESTIIGQEMIDELADTIGLRERISAITAKAMAGELAFEDALRSRVGLLAGLPAAVLDEIAGRITLNPGARTLVRTMRRNGAYTALVSGGFTCFTALVREACGFHEDQANQLVLEGGHLSGAVAEPVLGRGAKLTALKRLAAAKEVPPAAVCAVGDGANDADMLAAAGLGVAYRGKAPARAAASALIDHGDLTALLYLQGYRRSEFAD